MAERGIESPFLDDASNSEDELDGSIEIDESGKGEHLLTAFQAAVMFIKFCVGSGIFVLPSSFKHSGIILGVFSVLIIGLFTLYGCHKLLQVALVVSKTTKNPTVSIANIGEECAKKFSPDKGYIGRWLVDFLVLFSLFCLLIPQQIFIAVHFKQGMSNLIDMGLQQWILVGCFVLAPLFLTRRANVLSYFTMFASVILGIAIATLLVYIFMNTSEWKAVITVEWSELPLTFGIANFALLLAPIVLPLENTMRKPNQAPLVINAAMGIILLLYTSFASLAYAYCNDHCEDSIFLNLPWHVWYFSVVKVLVGLCSCVTTCLLAFVIFEIFESIEANIIPEKHLTLVSVLFRMFILTLSTGIAAAVPQLANMMSFVASIMVPIYTYIFPGISAMILMHQDLSKTDFAKNIALVLFGLTLFICGPYTSLYAIIQRS